MARRGHEASAGLDPLLAGARHRAEGDKISASACADEVRSLKRQTAFLPWAGATHTLARLARAEDPRRAEELEHEALDISVKGGFVPQAIDSIEGLATLAVDAESHAEAVRLLGAAQAARDAIGYVRFPIERPSRDAVMTTLVKEDEFAAAWAEGTALSFDEAIAYATRERGERKRPSHGWASLTPTERQIVALVREGLTNPQIAERLFIAKGTVRIHLQHVFRKLAADARRTRSSRGTARCLGDSALEQPSRLTGLVDQCVRLVEPEPSLACANGQPPTRQTAWIKQFVSNLISNFISTFPRARVPHCVLAGQRRRKESNPPSALRRRIVVIEQERAVR